MLLCRELIRNVDYSEHIKLRSKLTVVVFLSDKHRRAIRNHTPIDSQMDIKMATVVIRKHGNDNSEEDIFLFAYRVTSEGQLETYSIILPRRRQARLFFDVKSLLISFLFSFDFRKSKSLFFSSFAFLGFSPINCRVRDHSVRNEPNTFFFSISAVGNLFARRPVHFTDWMMRGLWT